VQELERVEGMMRGEAEEEEDEEGEGELEEEYDSQGEGGDAHSAGMVDAEGQTGFDFGTYCCCCCSLGFLVVGPERRSGDSEGFLDRQMLR
jgi:hypothetical protein